MIACNRLRDVGINRALQYFIHTKSIMIAIASDLLVSHNLTEQHNCNLNRQKQLKATAITLNFATVNWV